MKLRISIIFIICIFMCSCGVEKNSVKNTLKPTNGIESNTNTTSSASVAERSEGKLDSYWKNTSAFDTINKFVTMNYAGLKDDIMEMLAGA